MDARPQHAANKAFKQGMPKGAPDLEVVFPRPELGVRFNCTLHSWKAAYVTVVEHDFYAVSDDAGDWSIEGLPPGKYIVEAWHEKYGKQKAVFSIGAGEEAEVAFGYASRRVRREREER